jgi:RNA polymerase-binding protein DksA
LTGGPDRHPDPEGAVMVVKRTLSAARSTAAQAVETARNAVTRGAASDSEPTDASSDAAASRAQPATKATTPAGKKRTAKKAATKKTATKKTATTKSTAKKSAATTSGATKAAPTKAAPTKAAPKKAAATKAAPTKAAPTKAAPTKAAATKSTATKSAAPRRSRASSGELPVRADESPWTEAELREVRAEIEDDIAQLRREIEHAESDLVDLMRDSGDGAGDDQADAGAKTHEREQEITLANNAREMLEQNEHALVRLDDGTYGICESCGNPIGKLRLQAAPRATLCMPCKTEQERR